jgi:dynein heavy chain
VQPFVKKCFEAVKELVFEDGHIVGLISGEGEKITFNAHVDPVALGGLPADELLCNICSSAAFLLLL